MVAKKTKGIPGKQLMVSVENISTPKTQTMQLLYVMAKTVPAMRVSVKALIIFHGIRDLAVAVLDEVGLMRSSSISIQPTPKFTGSHICIHEASSTLFMSCLVAVLAAL